MIKLKLSRLTRYEIELANLVSNSGQGLHCERIAGSGRRIMSVCDCILTFSKQSHYIELKTTKNSLFRINGKNKVQLQRLWDFCNQNGFNEPILVVKFLRRGHVFMRLNGCLPKSINYYDFNKNPVRIIDFLSNNTLVSAVSFDGVEKVSC